MKKRMRRGVAVAVLALSMVVVPAGAALAAVSASTDGGYQASEVDRVTFATNNQAHFVRRGHTASWKWKRYYWHRLHHNDGRPHHKPA